MDLTKEEFQHIIQSYQQRLANEELLSAQLAAKFHTATARIATLEAAATPKPGPAKEPAHA